VLGNPTLAISSRVTGGFDIRFARREKSLIVGVIFTLSKGELKLQHKFADKTETLHPGYRPCKCKFNAHMTLRIMLVYYKLKQTAV